MWLKKNPLNLKTKQLEGEKSILVGVKGITDTGIMEVVHCFLLMGQLFLSHFVIISRVQIYQESKKKRVHKNHTVLP